MICCLLGVCHLQNMALSHRQHSARRGGSKALGRFSRNACYTQMFLCAVSHLCDLATAQLLLVLLNESFAVLVAFASRVLQIPCRTFHLYRKLHFHALFSGMNVPSLLAYVFTLHTSSAPCSLNALAVQPQLKHSFTHRLLQLGRKLCLFRKDPALIFLVKDGEMVADPSHLSH